MKTLFDTIEITARAQWRDWLSTHHTQTRSIWLVRYKANTSLPRATWDDLVEKALAFGWIDSLPREGPRGERANQWRKR